MPVQGVRPQSCPHGQARPRPRAALPPAAQAAPAGQARSAGGIGIFTATPSPREVKQQVLEKLLAGANANKVRDLAVGRPDLMDAASSDQRARMAKTLLDRFFFGASDRQAILAILKPAQPLGELPDALAAVKAHGRLPALYKQMGDLDEGLELARLGLAGGVYNELGLVADLGLNGVKSLVRVATNEQLKALPQESKLTMIAILQAGPVDDEIELMIRRIRNHL